MPPEAFKPIIELAAAGRLAPNAVALFQDLDAAAKASSGDAYEDLERVDPGLIRSYLEPCVATIERAREFERLLVALDPAGLAAVTPQLRQLTVPTLVVWGTGDTFFDVSWASRPSTTTASAPRPRSSPSLPGLLVVAVTWCPCVVSCGSSCCPIAPAAPATNTRITAPFVGGSHSQTRSRVRP
jgi:pimeloyl-ACP methyl ester carboxylesterase